MKKSTKDALNNVLDTFSGADGGVKFAMFMTMLEGREMVIRITL